MKNSGGTTLIYKAVTLQSLVLKCRYYHCAWPITNSGCSESVAVPLPNYHSPSGRQKEHYRDTGLYHSTFDSYIRLSLVHTLKNIILLSACTSQYNFLFSKQPTAKPAGGFTGQSIYRKGAPPYTVSKFTVYSLLSVY